MTSPNQSQLVSQKRATSRGMPLRDSKGIFQPGQAVTMPEISRWPETPLLVRGQHIYPLHVAHDGMYARIYHGRSKYLTQRAPLSFDEVFHTTVVVKVHLYYIPKYIQPGIHCLAHASVRCGSGRETSRFRPFRWYQSSETGRICSSPACRRRAGWRYSLE